MINLNIKKERELIYSEIQNRSKNIKGYYSIKNLNNKNVFFDMSKYNEYFFNVSQNKTFKLKLTSYVNYIKDIIDDKRLEGFKFRTVYINIDSWISDQFQRLKTVSLDNPIMIFYMLLKKDPDTFKSLGNVDFIIYDNQGYHIRLNPSLCDNKTHIQFKIELIRMSKFLEVLDREDFEATEEKKQEIINNVLNTVYQYFRFVGNNEVNPDEEFIHDAETPDVDEELAISIKEKITNEIDNMDLEGKDPQEVITKIEDKLFNDQLVVKKYYNEVETAKIGRSNVSLKRDQELRDKQKELKLNGKTLKEIHDMAIGGGILETVNVASKMKTTNVNMTKIKYPSFEKTYNEKLFKKDLMNIITSLNNKPIPVYVRNVKVEDSSNELYHKETYRFDLEDANRVRHSLTFDMPKFIDHKFLYLNGNKKIIIKQLFLKPIVKTRPDTVQICTNYNKVFIFRHGEKLSSKLEKFKKAMASTKDLYKIQYGDNTAINSKYKSIIEYDELAKTFSSIKIKNLEVIFNQKIIEEELTKRKIKLKDNEMCIGFTGEKRDPLTIDYNTQTMGTFDIVDFIISTESGKAQIAYDEATGGKKFMYTRAKIMNKFIPLIVLLGFCEGLSTVLKKSEIKHYFTDKRPQINDAEQNYIQFGDGYLVYDIYPIKNSLLINGLTDVPTKSFNYSDFDSKDAYVTLFDVMFNSRIIANALRNSYNFLIDPITEEVLNDLNYPTDYVGLMLLANELLSDNAYMKENNMNLYRIRSNEMVNAYLHKAISRAYLDYELTSHNPHPKKISIEKDRIIKDLLTSQVVEDYSILKC
jgi:hypothetical protein